MLNAVFASQDYILWNIFLLRTDHRGHAMRVRLENTLQVELHYVHFVHRVHSLHLCLQVCVLIVQVAPTIQALAKAPVHFKVSL